MNQFLVLLTTAAIAAVHAQTIEWQSNLGGSKARFDQLLVSDDYVFAQGGSSLMSLEHSSGNPHIGVVSPSNLESSSASTTMLQAYEKKSTTHYLLSYYQETGDVVAFDTRLNEMLWTLHKISTAPVIDREYGVGIFLLTNAGQLLAVDSMSRFPVFSLDHNMPTTSTLHLSLDNEKLYILSPDGQLQIHSALDGSLLSSPYFEHMEEAFIVGDFLYLYKDDMISAYSLVDDTTTPLWTTHSFGDLYNVKPMQDDKHVLLLTSTGLHKVKHWSGKVKWTYAPDTDTMDIVSYSSSSDGTVYAVLELLEQPTYLVKLNGKTGEKSWTYYETDKVIVGDVALHENHVYVMTTTTKASLHQITKLSDNDDDTIVSLLQDAVVTDKQ